MSSASPSSVDQELTWLGDSGPFHTSVFFDCKRIVDVMSALYSLPCGAQVFHYGLPDPLKTARSLQNGGTADFSTPCRSIGRALSLISVCSFALLPRYRFYIVHLVSMLYFRSVPHFVAIVVRS